MDRTAQAGRWTRFATCDLEQAEAWIVANLSRITITSAGEGPFSFSAVTASIGDALVSRVRNTMTGSAGYEPWDTVFVCRSRAGRYVAHPPGQPKGIVPGDVFVTYAARGFDFSFDDVDFDVVSIPTATLKAAAVDLLGYDPGRLLFNDMAPISAAAKQHWLATMAYTYRALVDNPTSLDNPLVVGAMTRNMAAAILATFPNTAAELAGQGRAVAVPATLRRAVSFIEANADRDISVADIAAAARVTPRALQAAFRGRLDMTPTAYLRQVRLAAAHRDLIQAQPGSTSTVAEIAARWGFADPGRFSVAYRRAYGEPPSHTLRR